ncbi:MAG: GTPase HflX, partial [Candidatus Omnitrophica bacterium]|nr:GTPase HflX [Candidatus Omnitrophota bacterium]
LETDHRTIKARVSKLTKDLAALGRRRDMMRTNRSRHSLPTIAIVGYTNAGKSTLINALTGSDVVVRNKLFATLDPTVRKLVMPNNQKVLFIDTVGFIKELPHHLVEAFKATLEEVTEADFLLHIVDASHPKAMEQAEAVYEVLKEIGAIDKPTITALNKTDKAEGRAAAESLKGRFSDPVAISAIKKDGLDRLISRILHYIKDSTVVINISIPAGDVKTLNLIHENGFIRDQKYRGEELLIEAEVPIRLKEMLGRRFCGK